MKKKIKRKTNIKKGKTIDPKSLNLFLMFKLKKEKEKNLGNFIIYIINLIFTFPFYSGFFWTIAVRKGKRKKRKGRDLWAILLG